jgi:hypothetical protein
VVALALGAGPRTVLTGALTVSAFGYVLAYALACLAMPLFLRRIGELTALSAVAGCLAAAAGAAGLGAAMAGASLWGGQAMTVVFLAAVLPGVAWAGWLRWRAPGRLASVGVYDQATASSVLPGSVPAEPAR